MGLKSAVAKANSKSPSLRTTIPKKIVQEIQIKPGDILDWEITSQRGRRVMRIKKLE